MMLRIQDQPHGIISEFLRFDSMKKEGYIGVRTWNFNAFMLNEALMTHFSLFAPLVP